MFRATRASLALRRLLCEGFSGVFQATVAHVSEGANIAVLFRDAAYVVVDKPSGIVVHPGWAQDDGGVVKVLGQQLGQKVYPLHRLDRGASGVLAFALERAAAQAGAQAFAEGRVHKSYIAIVRGHPPAHVVVDHAIPNEEGSDTRVPAVTEVHRLGVWERYGLVLAQPRTGRLHQIRRHLKHLSCPLIGDANYGKSEHNRFFKERFGLHRLALHAVALSLPREDGTYVHVQAPMSGSLAACVEAMGLAGAVAEAVARLPM